MGKYAHNLDNLEEEIFEIIPMSFLSSPVFEKEILKSQYGVQWSILVGLGLTLKESLEGKDAVTKVKIKSICRSLIQDGAPSIYKFISFLVKSYCENNNKKINLKKIRATLFSIGVLNTPEIDIYSEDAPFANNLTIEITKWNEIKDAICRLENECRYAETTMDFQNLGNSCRYLLIKVAQMVYDSQKHNTVTETGVEIGKNDAEEMLSSYFDFSLKGKHNKYLKAYAKATNDLANKLTHDMSATKKDMLLAVSATINLIYIVGTIGDKFNQESFM